MIDVAGRSRANMFEQIKSPSGKVYEPIAGVGDRITYRVKGTNETVECSNYRKDGATLDMLNAHENGGEYGYPMLGMTMPSSAKKKR